MNTKRYIEIVLDNSGSMSTTLGNEPRYIVAQRIFEASILPAIGEPGDKVALRLLRHGCSGHSHMEILPNDRSAMLDRIRKITPGGDTPLYYTTLDAINTCRNELADEYLIFVLTDGEDTCGVPMEKVIPKDLIDRFVRTYNVLLCQFAVDDPLTQNNLTAFSNYVGGTSVIIDGTGTLDDMNRILSQALVRTGFSAKIPLDPCYTRIKGFPVAWKELESQEGIDFHQACLLWQEGLLSWKPEADMQVDPTQAAELRFVHGVRIRSMLPETLVKAMFQQLQKPYHYAFDCIYWDFGKARWRYFPEKARLNVFEHPDNEVDDMDLFEGKIKDALTGRSRPLPAASYGMKNIYRVEMTAADMPRFTLRRTHPLDIDHPIVLHPGDKVVFHP
jgi:hypothetical protein